MKIRIEAEVECDRQYYGSGENLSEDTRWLIDYILLSGNGDLILHSNEIGDEVGRVRVLKAVVDTSEEFSQ